ncbi:MAG TPA: ABC transporter permease [Flavobacteriales bacterium]|nr:ABC transporter permease [Flavobacteriales bacterium]
MTADKTIIKASKGIPKLELKELLQYKDLFILLAYRDYRVRYAQTFLGFFWAFIQPFATLLIFTIVFGKAVKVDTGGIPYPLFAVCGMAAWTFFAFVLSNSGSSIVGAQGMIQKIYFPKLIIPLAKAIVGFVDFGIGFLFISILCIYYNFIPSSNIVFLPIFILITIFSALTIGIWLSALTIRFRDFQHIVPFLVQFGLYATPIAYPADLITNTLPKWASILYFLNPMAGVVEGFRWSILGGAPPSDYAYISYAMIFVLFTLGLFYFKKVEETMADIV